MLRKTGTWQPVQKLVERGFHVQAPWAVAWGEMDCFGHVNNVTYIRYFESARIVYFNQLNIGAEPDSHSKSDDDKIKPIMATISCSFKRPLTFPDHITLGCRVSSMDAASGKFMLEHVVWSESQQVIAAIGEGLAMSYDYGALKRAPMPAAWVKEIQVLDNPPPMEDAKSKADGNK